ncbi:MAG TPA: thioesterase family protein [Mycobacteriales bacterium]|nr:thioesterase family protein [Mycobacteriales bacterium]
MLVRMGYRFDQDTAVTAVEGSPPDGRPRYGVTLDPEWGISPATLHGGYLLAVACRAGLADDPHPDLLAAAASFLRTPSPGPAEATVERTRTGRRVGFSRVLLSQDGAPFLDATVTTGTLTCDDPEWADGAAVRMPVGMPAPEECPEMPATLPDGRPIGMRSVRESRLDPRMPWLAGRFDGPPETAGWLRFADGREPDDLSMPFFADGLPPVTFARGELGWVPTVQMTVLVRARPAPGWVLARMRGGHQTGGYLDEDAQVWDSAGRLVAQARQLAVTPRPSRPRSG